ncbi:DUF983 domain-containing protein [Emticicia sp. CRIBPO]|uniref:DUF983 domain-containing protein n=1 Tax=Emticicia sp. CRIBPO TaxID=2683258 RepID=UPI00141355B7|nr:DUF983 domain-containing protein [Emticicia sp. CRIBPO]NBA88192.1 DUF983 domain-containing protein [Emticicia sp. CRIBPO]
MGNLSTALQLKCPRCGEGELFEAKNPYTKGKMLAMHTHCPNCGLRYERENGFFYGAMYISYMFNIALFVTAITSYYLFFEDMVDWRWFIGGYVALTGLLTPIIFRLSRSIWIMFMVKYDPEKRGAK